MLAKEVIEDSLLSFLTQAPDVEVEGDPTSQKVITFCYSLMQTNMFSF